ncbi:MAG: hypothetical protein IJ443_00565 [Firmicutes bacterium]|nr:hypothetical protein [Bacillota bacterium]
MATDRPRYTVSVDNELFQQIEDFRFEHRFQTRSEATVELIRLGLEALKKEQVELKKTDKTSGTEAE